MRRNDREIQDPEIIQRMLQSAEVCRIGMYDGEYPYVLPVNFAYDTDTGLLFFHSAKTGKKTSVLGRHPQVCIEIDEPGNVIDNGPPCNAEYTYSCIIARGLAVLCTEMEERKRALQLLTRKYLHREHSFSNEELQSVAVYKVKIAELSGKQHQRESGESGSHHH